LVLPHVLFLLHLPGLLEHHEDPADVKLDVLQLLFLGVAHVFEAERRIDREEVVDLGEELLRNILLDGVVVIGIRGVEVVKVKEVVP